MRTISFNGYKRVVWSIECLLSVHLTGLFLSSLLRLAFFLSADYRLPCGTGFGEVYPAFIRGLWFDNVIGCYILIVPLAAVCLCALANYYGRILWRCIGIYLGVLYGVVFLVTAANIPYFNYFFKIINSSIYNWFGYMNTTAGMVFGETSYYPPLAGFAVTLALFVWASGRLIRRFGEKIGRTPSRLSLPEWGLALVTAAACIGLCLFGIRGRTGYNPIKVSAAYYGNDPFLNQLGVSPVFNLLSSTLDDRRKENRYLHLMADEEAVANACRLLEREGVAGVSPLAKEVVAENDSVYRPNIVLIFMESMSANLMQRFGQEKALTPFLDSLYGQCVSFRNFYSSGIHTNHGMYSTLYSFPAIMKRNAMKGSVIPVYAGLPTVLKENGYRTLFFMTHESQYDNMNAFFRTNGFDEIFSQEDYPPEKVVNGFGVQDDFLYGYALERLNERASGGEPFFSVLLSISNHPPYVIPPYFHPKSSAVEEGIVEYADWSIRRFMEEAMRQEWASNTLFVLLGDHGKLVGNPDTEMPHSYNHIPLMFYAPGKLAPAEVEAFGGQVDVAPTLLGLLGISYVRNNFGVDLLREKRPCMFFTADNMIGARNERGFYVYVPESNQEFRYLCNEKKLEKTSPEAVTNSLKNYAFSMLQAAEYLVKQQLTTDKIAQP
ncbi:MAG: sulfatase-like hydrolase/transferase [Odoribacter sp.]|nr:sulfatase-like hydrolase/transferase [Odoribacter sp.]